MKALSFESFKAFFAMMTARFATKDYVNAACRKKPVVINLDMMEYSWQSRLSFDEISGIALEDPSLLVINENWPDGPRVSCIADCVFDDLNDEDKLYIRYSGSYYRDNELVLNKNGLFQLGFPD